MTNDQSQSRRSFLKLVGAGATGAALGPASTRAQELAQTATLVVGSQAQYDLSPHLYMQFMEPLGTTDGSVAAAWDFAHDHWRRDVVDVTKNKLSPTMMRWGGCFSSYYRWKEAVGPRDQRIPMLNMCWGGVDTNQVGTEEFVDFCHQVNADPLMCVNFESDGRAHWEKDPKGSIRVAGATEAAEWVSFCNNSRDPLRKQLAIKKPCKIPFWQIGNETSYSRGAFGTDDDKKRIEIAARKTVEFAVAMHKADPSIQLIGWGDSGWARRMLEVAGEHLQYIAFHHMFNPDQSVKDSPLRDLQYREDPDRTWEHLLGGARVHDAKIQRICDETKDLAIPLALTECHFALPGRNRNEVLSSWTAGVANALLLNVHQRHGNRLKIATCADFCGTRWLVNAIMIPVPRGQAFLMPVALVMSLYRHHTGEKALHVAKTPDGLDVVASRTSDRVFLHVVNTHRTQAVAAKLHIQGCQITGGKVFQLAADSQREVLGPNAVPVTEHAIPANANWQFPAASVSAVELEITVHELGSS